MSRRKNIIRIGDTVRIHRPFRFVRCGYNLTLPEVAEELLRDKKEEIEALVRSAYQSTRGSGKSGGSYRLSDLADPSPFQLTCQEVAFGLAKGVIKARGYGGSERRLFEEEDRPLLGKKLEVQSIRFVQTGNRVSGGWSGYEEPEYEPPYLEDQKTHKVLTLGWFPSAEILAENCQKVETLDEFNDGIGYEEFRLCFVDRENHTWRYLCKECQGEFMIGPGRENLYITGPSSEQLPRCPHCGTTAHLGKTRISA